MTADFDDGYDDLHTDDDVYDDHNWQYPLCLRFPPD